MQADSCYINDFWQSAIHLRFAKGVGLYPTTKNDLSVEWKFWSLAVKPPLDVQNLGPEQSDPHIPLEKLTIVVT